MFARKVHDLRDLGFRDLVRKDAAFADPVVVNMQHNSCGGFVVLSEEAFQYVHDELHRRVIVIENKDPVHIRPLGLRLGLGNDRRIRSALFVPALAILVGHLRGASRWALHGRIIGRKRGHHGQGIAFRGCTVGAP